MLCLPYAQSRTPHDSKQVGVKVIHTIEVCLSASIQAALTGVAYISRGAGNGMNVGFEPVALFQSGSCAGISWSKGQLTTVCSLFHVILPSWQRACQVHVDPGRLCSCCVMPARCLAHTCHITSRQHLHICGSFFRQGLLFAVSTTDVQFVVLQCHSLLAQGTDCCRR